jgi:hypothetical protein
MSIPHSATIGGWIFAATLVFTAVTTCAVAAAAPGPNARLLTRPHHPAGMPDKVRNPSTRLKSGAPEPLRHNAIGLPIGNPANGLPNNGGGPGAPRRSSAPEAPGSAGGVAQPQIGISGQKAANSAAALRHGSINGTNLIHPSAAASALGGPAKTATGINGSTFRRKR